MGHTLGGLALAGQLVALGRHPAEGFAMDLAVAAHGHPAHVLRPTGDHDVGGAGRDSAGGEMHRHLARAAFAVDGQAGNGYRPASAKQCGARDIGRLLADLGDTAENHVIDLFEVNEAFASVPLAWMCETGVSHERLNVNGGAIALGHPLGASGARLMTTLLNELERRGARYGLQAICCAGGMGTATIIERLD